MFLLTLFACNAHPAASPASSDVTGGRTATAFTDASAEELSAVFASAFGYGSLVGYFSSFTAQSDAVAEIEDDDGVECPAARFDGSVLTMTASGCTGEVSGAVWSGATVAANAPGVGALVAESLFGEDLTDPASPYRFEFDGWVQSDAAGETEIDGSFGASDWGTGAAWTTEQDLRVGMSGYPAYTTTAALSCERAGDGSVSCAPTVEQVGEVEGLGTFGVIGDATTDPAGNPVGTIVVEGAEDSIRFDLGDFDFRCVDGLLEDGSTVEVCLPGVTAEDPPVNPESGAIDEGPLWGVFGPNFFEEGLIAGVVVAEEVASVDLDLNGSAFGAVSFESHPMGIVGENPEEGTWTWGVELAYGSYVPGSSTALPPGPYDTDLATRLVARDADGAAIGCLFLVPSGSPDDWFDNAECPRL